MKTHKQSKSNFVPVRYKMSAAHFSACFAAIGKSPPQANIYADLPPAAAALPKNLVARKGKLNANAWALFTLLADPKRVLIFHDYFAGQASGIETRFIGSTNGDQWVIVSKKTKDHWDIALLTSKAQMLATLDMLTDISSHTPTDEEFITNLSIAAIATLAAIADKIRLDALQQEINSEPVDQIWLGRFEPIDLLRVAEKTRKNPATYSKVLLMSLLSAGASLQVSTQEHFASGCDDLIDAGLLEDDQTLTADGHVLVSLLLHPDSISAFDSLQKRTGGVIANNIFFLQTKSTLLCGIWDRGGNGNINALTLALTKPLQALKILEDTLFTSQATHSKLPQETNSGSPAKFCPECGNANKQKLKFCTKCGTKL